MHKELTTEQLAEILHKFLSLRCDGIDPSQPNLRFCPAVESCDGPARSIVLRFHTYPWMSNPIGFTHGGMITAILDSSMGILCSAFCGEITPTVSMTTNYCRMVPLDTEILVRVRIFHLGSTSAQMSAEMYLPGEECRPLATATGVFYTAHANK